MQLSSIILASTLSASVFGQLISQIGDGQIQGTTGTEAPAPAPTEAPAPAPAAPAESPAPAPEAPAPAAESPAPAPEAPAPAAESPAPAAESSAPAPAEESSAAPTPATLVSQITDGQVQATSAPASFAIQSDNGVGQLAPGLAAVVVGAALLI